MNDVQRYPASYDFSGRTAIVTGAAQGIGNRIAVRLAQSGATVVVADRSADMAKQAAEEITAAGFEAKAYHVDVTDAAEVDGLMSFADGDTHQLSILVNNAAISTTPIIEDLDEQSWRTVVDVNLTGPFLTSKAAVPYLRSNGGGKIVNIASVAAKRISYNASASYTASKAGLLAFTRHLAYEVARDHIHVNAVCPGPVSSPMLERTATTETIDARRSSVPAGRLTTPDDQADLVMFLTSSSSDMITGSAIDVDGGALLGWYDVATYFDRRVTHG